MIEKHYYSGDRFGPEASGRYVILNMDQLALLIPQRQVQALEPAFDVQRSNGDDVGWITLAGARSPVYCLSDNLQPIWEVPANRQICVLLHGSGELFGVLCDQVVILEQAELGIKPLPECMHVPNTPLRGLVLLRDKVMCISSADKLLVCLGGELDQASELSPRRRLNEGLR